MTVSGPGGEPALAAEVMTQLPDGLYLAAVLGVAELRVSFQPWPAQRTRIPPPEQMAISFDRFAENCRRNEQKTV